MIIQAFPSSCIESNFDVFLVSPYNFLILTKSTHSVTLLQDSISEVGTFEDAYLIFTIAGLDYQTPIIVKSISTKQCQVDHLSFQESTIYLTYYIGSGSLKKTLPSVI